MGHHLVGIISFKWFLRGTTYCFNTYPCSNDGFERHLLTWNSRPGRKIATSSPVVDLFPWWISNFRWVYGCLSHEFPLMPPTSKSRSSELSTFKIYCHVLPPKVWILLYQYIYIYMYIYVYIYIWRFPKMGVPQNGWVSNAKTIVKWMMTGGTATPMT